MKRESERMAKRVRTLTEQRTADDLSSETARHPAAKVHSLDEARREALACHACPLWRDGTQAVFGDGAPRAAIMLVGEQPGDSEDRVGKPFVGPAGRMLDRALHEAGIARHAVYVTNAVKHFKHVPRGNRRLHKKPAEAEIEACHPWLERELEFVSPRLVVAMGATAVRSLLGRAEPIAANRGRLLSLPTMDAALLITVHPSSLLRIPDDKAAAYSRFVADLKTAARFVGS